MTRSDHERVADMLDALDELAAIVAQGREAFDASPIVRRAVERLLEIVGEAANGVSDRLRERTTSVPWRDIARLRIVIAHHYHRVDPAQVWEIAESECPRLAHELRAAAF